MCVLRRRNKDELSEYDDDWCLLGESITEPQQGAKGEPGGGGLSGLPGNDGPPGPKGATGLFAIL